MRNGKSFLLLLVVAAGLGYYAYFVEPTKETTREAKIKREKLFTVDSDKIDKLTRPSRPRWPDSKRSGWSKRTRRR
mgnify:CR=1 FL=1